MNPSAVDPSAASPSAANPSAANPSAANPSAANPGPANHSDLVEASLSNLRENRTDVARWLAIEVLLAHPDALADDELVDRLCHFQDRLEALTRVRYGVA